MTDSNQHSRSQAGYEFLYREVCAERTRLLEQYENLLTASSPMSDGAQRAMQALEIENAGLKEQLETLTARNQFLSTEQVRADVAEAALTELKEQLEAAHDKSLENWHAAEAARKERSDAVEVAARAMDRSQSLQEQLEALRNVLLKIVGPNPNFDPDGQHDYGWEQPPPKPFAPGWVRDLANDALIASSPASEPKP